MNRKNTKIIIAGFLLGTACLPAIPLYGKFSAGHGAQPSGERKRHPNRPTSSTSRAPQAHAAELIRNGDPSSLEHVLREWHERDPATLEQWLKTKLPFPDSAEGIVAALARAGLPHLALDHSLALPETLRDNCLRTIFSVQAATSPLAAWNLAETLESPALKETARDIILETGTDAKLPQLADLALSHMNSSGRAGAMQNVLSRWALQDPAEAAAWLNENPVPPGVRDGIARHLVFQCDGENRPPETALAWAESISDPIPRFQAMAAAARELASTHPDLAHQAIQRSDILSRDEKQSLITSMNQPPRHTDFQPAD